MIEPFFWKDLIRKTVFSISNKAHQKLHWFNPTGNICDPGELYNRLFDDYTIDLFLEDPSIDLNNNQKKLGYNLIQLMDDYLNNGADLSDIPKVFEDPKWEEIRQAAKMFYKALEEPVK